MSNATPTPGKTNEAMDEFLRYQQRILLICAILCGAGIAAAFLAAPGHTTYGFGALLGTFSGLLKFRLDVLAILRFAQSPTEEGQQAVKRSFHTMALTFGTLVIALCLPGIFNVWAVFGGMMLPRIVLAGDGVLRPGAMATGDQSPNGGAQE